MRVDERKWDTLAAAGTIHETRAAGVRLTARGRLCASSCLPSRALASHWRRRWTREELVHFAAIRQRYIGLYHRVGDNSGQPAFSLLSYSGLFLLSERASEPLSRHASHQTPRRMGRPQRTPKPSQRQQAYIPGPWWVPVPTPSRSVLPASKTGMVL